MTKQFSDQEERDLGFVFQLFEGEGGGGGDGILELEDLRRALALLGFKPSFKNLRQMALDVELSLQRTAVYKKGANSRGGAAGTRVKSSGGEGPKTDLQGFLHIVAGLQDTGYDHYEEMTQARHVKHSNG